jgi:asparagine synthase (glutamine-hydrolysing)
MCGIVGLASRWPVRDPDRLLAMRETLCHRGPDDAGTYRAPDGRVWLGHRRLAIIDLSPAGHQPMADARGDLCITFNGEIYNYRDLRRELEGMGHRFRSASDTEVVLAAYRAWGVECLPRLNGMFAFALFDRPARRVFLARDRAGEKPLFYRVRGDELAFASELKALMADPSCPRALSVPALNHYLAYGYVPGELCILDGVHKLGPGRAMTYDLETGDRHTWPYWQLPATAGTATDGSAEELTAELEAILEDAVRRRLVADVPVGILLSGGIDSGLVTAMAARVSSTPVRTFTVTFPGHDRHDEGPYARQVAEHFGTSHHELVAEPMSVALLPALARQFDEPIADSALVPTYLVSRLIRQHATVALGGDGGDELFGGYPHYQWLQRETRLRRFLPGTLRTWVGAAAGHYLPVGARGRHHLLGLAGDLSHRIAHVNLYFDGDTRRRLLAPLDDGDGPAGLAPEAYRAGLCRRSHTPLRQATEADFLTTLSDGYLVKVDRASMLTSLEVRAPWLDHRLIEFAFGRVPDALRATGRRRKVLPRRLAQRLLPATMDLTRKWGFSMPLARWFRGEWGAFVEAVLREADPSIFDRRVIARLLEGQRRGYANTGRLFALAFFELWRREYRVTVSGSSSAWPAHGMMS